MVDASSWVGRLWQGPLASQVGWSPPVGPSRQSEEPGGLCVPGGGGPSCVEPAHNKRDDGTPGPWLGTWEEKGGLVRALSPLSGLERGFTPPLQQAFVFVVSRRSSGLLSPTPPRRGAGRGGVRCD